MDTATAGCHGVVHFVIRRLYVDLSSAALLY